MTRLQRTKRSNWKIVSGHWDYTKKRQTIFHPIDLFVQTKRYKLDLLPTTKLWICYSKTVKETRHCGKDKETKKKKRKRKKHGRVYIGHSLRHNLYNRHKLRFSYRSQAPYPSLFLFLSPRHVSWRQNNFPSKADKASPGEFLHFKITRLANCRGRYTVTWFISSLTLYFTSWSLLFRANTFR